MAITQRMTLEQFLELPEEKPGARADRRGGGAEVAPQWEHGLLQPSLAELINRFARPRRLAVAATGCAPPMGAIRWCPTWRCTAGSGFPATSAAKW